jgi:hypothetical protein
VHLLVSEGAHPIGLAQALGGALLPTDVPQPGQPVSCSGAGAVEVERLPPLTIPMTNSRTSPEYSPRSSMRACLGREKCS